MSRFAVSQSVSRLLAIFVVLSVVLSAGAYAQTTSTTTTVGAKFSGNWVTSSTLGQPVAFTATVTTSDSGVPVTTGQVIFEDSNNGVVLGVANVNGSGQAVFTTALLVAGNQNIVAQYAGNSSYTPSTSSTLPFNVGQRPTSVASINFSDISERVGTGTTATVTVTDAATTGPVGTAGAGAPGSFALTAHSLQAAAMGHTATLLQDGTVLIVGGKVGDDAFNEMEVFTPSSDPLNNGAFGFYPLLLLTARGNHTATLVQNGTVLVAGGSDGTNALSSAEMIDPARQSVSLSGNLKTARYGHTATLLSNGLVLIAGGADSNGKPVTTLEVYNPGNQSFAAVAGSLAANRIGHTATLLADGQTILVVGGDVDSNGQPNGNATAELLAYNSSTNSWATLSQANLPAAISGHTATLLPDGTVVITGGLTGGLATNAVVLFQPPTDLTKLSASNFITLSSTLKAVRTNHTATLLDGGLVLIVGGSDGTTAYASAEIYTPSYDPQGPVLVTSTDTGAGTTDVVSSSPCTLTPTGNGAPTCTATITPVAVGTNPHIANSSYAGDNNHGASSGTASISVQPGTPVITPTGGTFVYNGQPRPGSGTATGYGGVTLSPAVTLTYSGTGGTTYGPTSIAPTNVGTYQVVANFAGNADYNPGCCFPQASLTITQAPLTITPNSFHKTYGTSYTFTGTEFTTSGLFGGDAVTSVSLSSLGAAATAQVAAYPITALAPAGTGLGNYSIGYVAGTMTLDKANQALLTVSGPASVTYGSAGTATTTGGGGTGAVTFSATGSGCAMSGGSLSEMTTVSVSNASGTCILTATKAADRNYNATTSAQYTVNLLKAALSVAVDAKSKVYGDPNPTLTGILSGAATNDGITASYSTVATQCAANSAVGQYDIIATLNDPNNRLSNNYTVTNTTAKLAITQAPLSVTVDSKSKVYGDPNPTFTGNGPVGLKCSDPVTASYSTTATQYGAFGKVSGSPYPITAALGDVSSKLSNYSVTNTPATLTITTKATSVTPNAAAKVYGSTDPTLTGTLTSFLPADGVTATYSRVAGETGGAYTISAVLSPAAVLSNYNVTYNTAQFTIAEVTVSAGSTSTSLTLSAGQQGSMQFIISSAAPVTSAITLACSGQPAGAQCVFSPASVNPANLPAKVTVTVTTTHLAIVGRNRQSGWPWMLAIFVPGLLLLPTNGSKHKRRNFWIAIGIVLLLTIAFVGCGGSPAGQSITNAQQSTPAGTYPVTVTASAGGVTQSAATFNLVVTP